MSQLYACTRLIRNALNKECPKHPMKRALKTSPNHRVRAMLARRAGRAMRRGAVVAASVASGVAALAAAWRQPIPGYGRPGGGVRPGHPTPSGRPPVRRDLHDAADYDAVGEHVEIVVRLFIGEARNRGALEDQRHDPKAAIALRRFTPSARRRSRAAWAAK